MKNFLFYLTTILIWGTSWIGIKLQLGSVEPMASVTYRFALATVILLVWCRIRGLNMQFSLQQHSFMLLQGIFLFGLNYLLFYIAELHVTSGLAAVIFSTILVMNMVNGAIFLKSPINGMVVIGGLLGLMGIILVFRPEIRSFSLENNGALGALLCVLATFSASLGNIASARNQKKGLPIIQTNAYGMGYGALLMLLMTLALGKPFGFEISPVYIGSLLYRPFLPR